MKEIYLNQLIQDDAFLHDKSWVVEYTCVIKDSKYDWEVYCKGIYNYRLSRSQGKNHS